MVGCRYRDKFLVAGNGISMKLSLRRTLVLKQKMERMNFELKNITIIGDIQEVGDDSNGHPRIVIQDEYEIDNYPETYLRVDKHCGLVEEFKHPL
jgi:hypothetical protein